MVRKKKENIPNTSLKGKQIKINDTNAKKTDSTNVAEISITPELKHASLGNYLKDSKKKDNKKNGEQTKLKINRQPSISDTGKLQQDEAALHNKKITFIETMNWKKTDTSKQQIIPSPVTSAEIHIKENECNTVSDLSTLQSQFHGETFWPSLQEKVMAANDAAVNILECYVKNNLFHSLKFISSPEMIMFSKDSRSLCQVVCALFNVPKGQQMSFWSMNSKYIPKFLNKKRADVCNGLKKQFQGKSMVNSACVTFNSPFASSF